jgi:hypothetical protein
MKLRELNKPLPKSELCNIAFNGGKYKTDKDWNGYTRIYYELLKEFKNDPIDFFEIGIYFGASIKMWHDFFTNGKIYGIDNGRLVPGANVHHGKDNIFMSDDDMKLMQPDTIIENLNYSWLENDRIKCFTADQRSEKQLKEAFKYFGCDTFDVILDDGQHFQDHQQKSIALMFPNIKSGRYYIIEDVVDYESMKNGEVFWGQKRKNATDSTDYVFTTFIQTGKLETPYMNEEQIKYIVDNIDDIFMYDRMNKNNSPINGTSKLLVIKKK